MKSVEMQIKSWEKIFLIYITKNYFNIKIAFISQ